MYRSVGKVHLMLRGVRPRPAEARAGPRAASSSEMPDEYHDEAIDDSPRIIDNCTFSSAASKRTPQQNSKLWEE